MQHQAPQSTQAQPQQPNQATQAPQSQDQTQQAPTAPTPRPRQAPDKAAKHAKAVEALRAERNTTLPQPPQPKSEHSSTTPPAPENKAALPPAMPNANDLLAQYDAIRRKAEADNASAQKALAEQKRLADEAAAHRKRIEDAVSNPVQLMSELNYTEDEWKEAMANGGKMTAQQKAMRDMQKQIADANARAEALEQRLTGQQLDSEINGVLSQYPLLRRVGGVQAVKAHMQSLQAQGQSPSVADAAKGLDAVFQSGINEILSDGDIAKQYKFKSPPPQQSVASPPATLGQTHTSQTQTQSAERSPYPPNSAQNRAYKHQLAVKRLKELGFGQ